MFKKILMGALAVSLLAIALSMTVYAGTWHKGRGENSGRWWYKLDDGSYAKDCTMSIDGTSYTFDKDGWMVEDAGKSVTVVSEGPDTSTSASTSSATSTATTPSPATGAASPSAGGSETGKALVAEASKYIGAGVVPYVSGGRTLAGTDCSGFLHIIYGMFGIDLPYTPTDIYAGARKLSESELQPGDFIFFTKNGGASISHVAIYAGDGYMVHQTNRARNGVFKDLISNMYLDGVTSYYGAGTYLR